MFLDIVSVGIIYVSMNACATKKQGGQVTVDSPKTLYKLAEDMVDAGSIDQAIEQYQIIISSYPGSKYAIQARLDIAYNLYKRKKYTRAIIELNKFIEKYPNLPSTPYAYYLRAIVAEDKPPINGRDDQSVRDAYDYFNSLIAEFPDSIYTDDAHTKLTNLVNTLAEHEFGVAIYYTKKGSYIAAINRSKYIIENYQNSYLVPDSLHLMAYNYDQINAKKLANDTRIVLSSSFPNYTKNYSIDVITTDVRMGTEGAYPPYNFINDDGEIDGFEKDLGDELCKRASLTCEWVSNEWGTIIPNLIAENYDTIIAGMSITAERDEVIDFTQAYVLPDPSAYVTLSGKNEAAIYIVAAQIGTIQASYVANSGATLVEFATPEETITAVRNGEADAVFADKNYLAPIVDGSSGELMFLGKDIFIGKGVGMGLRESDSMLKDIMNKAIDSMKSDGTLNALLKKWELPLFPE